MVGKMLNRYKVYSWLLNDIIMIDRKEKTYTFYSTNIHAQVYNLKEEPKKITTQKINGLIKRLNNNYSSLDSFVIDKFIFEVMTEDQKNKCKKQLNLNNEEYIAMGDNKKEVLKNICKHTFNKEYTLNNKVEDFKKYKKFYENEIASL